MNTKRKIIKWTAVTAGGILAAAVAYIGFNSFDIEPPDLAKFVNPFEIPSEADNVYYGLVAATNVVSEKTGHPVWASVFENYREAWEKFYRSNDGMTAEVKDAILSESEKVLTLFHEAAQRKTWYGYDQSGSRNLFPAINVFTKLCKLADLQAKRQLELGNIEAAIEGVRDMVLLTRKVEHDSESALRWLVAGVALNYADGIAMKIVSSGKATDEELGRLQDVLRQFDIESRSERMERMMNNEFYVYFMWMTDMKNFANLASSEELALKILRFPILGSYAYPRNRTWAIYASYLEKVKAGYRFGYDKAVWDKIDDEIPVICNHGWRFGPNFIGRKMMGACLPAWRSIGENVMRTNFRHSSAETIVAAARFKRKTGAFPKRLAELVPEYLPAVPRDPFTRDAELKYDPARGILWTVGTEGTFNGEPVKPNDKYSVYGKYGKENRNHVINIDGTPCK